MSVNIYSKIGLVLINFYSEKAILDYFLRNNIVSLCDEIVIVNNGSDSEKEFECIKKISDKITIINAGGNIGYAKANNIGIRELINKKVDYIIISNNDVEVCRNSVLACIEVLKKRNKIGAVAPRMQNADGTTVPLRYIPLGYKRLFLRVFIPETFIDNKTQSKLSMSNGVIEQSFLPGSFFVISAKAAKDCNGFDSGTFLYREEEILNKRLSKLGYKQAVLVNYCYKHLHKYKQESAKSRFKSCRILMESERLYFKKYLNANNFQMGLVCLLQWMYVGVRYLSWKKDEKEQ